MSLINVTYWSQMRYNDIYEIFLIYVACFQKSFEYIECMATFYFTNSNYLDMRYSSSKAKRTSFKLHKMRRASNYNFHNWTLFKTIFTDLEIQFITYLKPYSHGISIIWGPCVILKLPPQIWISCGAFAWDKRSLWLISRIPGCQDFESPALWSG